MSGRRIVRLSAGGGCFAVAALVALGAFAQDADFVMPTPIVSAEAVRQRASSFTFVRLRFSSPTQTGDAWATDYPDADFAFSAQVAALTGLDVDPGGRVLEITDPALTDYPFTYLVEGGRMALDDAEAAALRAYLEGGGFLLVDDFWGAAEWVSLATQLRNVFPDRPIVDLWGDHEVFWSYYAIAGATEVPGAAELATERRQAAVAAGVQTAGNGDRITGATTMSEVLEAIAGPATSWTADRTPRFRGILDDDGRLMVMLLFNMDLGDAWEHLEDPNYPKAASLGAAVPLGINAVVYALTR